MSTKLKQIPMNSLFAIVTHHERPLDAAEAWRECNVCAIGHESGPYYDLFLQIDMGDLIFAYSLNNRIAYVGEIKDGNLQKDNENIVSQEGKDGFGYECQYEVKWYDKPHHFSRKELPKDLWTQFGKRGKTVVRIEVDGKREMNAKSFGKVKEIIREVRAGWGHRR